MSKESTPLLSYTRGHLISLAQYKASQQQQQVQQQQQQQQAQRQEREDDDMDAADSSSETCSPHPDPPSPYEHSLSLSFPEAEPVSFSRTEPSTPVSSGEAKGEEAKARDESGETEWKRADEDIDDQFILLPGSYLVAYHEHPHTLLYQKAGRKYRCNKCNKKRKTESYSCLEDNFDVCRSCAAKIDRDFTPGQGMVKPTNPSDAPSYVSNVAFAFSGGGIRSASFCSGALSQFIQYHSAAPKLISSVSGGGYTTSAFVHWARAHAEAGVPVSQWAQHFYQHFHDGVGYFIRDTLFGWPSSALNSIGDVVVFIYRWLLWLIVTLLIMLPAMFPYALIFDSLLRDVTLEMPMDSIWNHLWYYLSMAGLAAASIMLYNVVHIELGPSLWRKRAKSFLWVVAALFLLLLALLLLSHSTLAVFAVLWSGAMLAMWLISMSQKPVGWTIALIAIWLLYWYAAVVSWYVNRDGLYDAQHRLVRRDRPLLLLFYHLHYRTFADVPEADGGLYSVTGHGNLAMAVMLTLAACKNILITFRNNIMPRYYKNSLSEAFYYRPERCHCGDDRKCTVYDQQRNDRLDAAVDAWYTRYTGLSHFRLFWRDTLEYGVLVAVFEAAERAVRAGWHVLRYNWLTMTIVGDNEASLRSHRWHEWCKHKLVLLRSWNTLPTAAGTPQVGLPEWVCVTTLNEQMQYEQSDMFNQFVLTSARSKTIAQADRLGSPLTQLEGAVEMRHEARAGMRINLLGRDRDTHAVLRVPQHEADLDNMPPELGLSDCMAISAAAFSFGMGRYAEYFTAIRGLRGLHGLLGLSLSKDVLATSFSKLFNQGGFFPLILSFAHVVVLLILVFWAFLWEEERVLHIFSYIYAGILTLEVLTIACWQTDSVELVPSYRAVRQLFGLSRVCESGTQPGILNLSDGGHTENFGLLPLFARQEPLIVICDGGADPLERMDELTDVLTRCREVWNIRFRVLTTGVADKLSGKVYDNWDLQRDIRTWALIEPTDDRHRQHVLKIHVTYPTNPAKIGLLLYLKPRKFTEVNHRTLSLHGCCCECCHTSLFCLCSKIPLMGGMFPHHSTGNQCFTPEMHRWYAGEGEFAMETAERWMRVWQKHIARKALITRLQLQHSRWYGTTGHTGAQRDDNVRVHPRALLTGLTLVEVHRPVQDPAASPSYICGIQAHYTMDETPSGPRTMTRDHGICSEKDFCKAKPALRGSLRNRLLHLAADTYFRRVHIRSGEQVDDLHFDTNAAAGEWQFNQGCQSPDVTINVEEFAHSRLHRIASKKKSGNECPLLAVRFTFAALAPRTARSNTSYG